MCLIIMRIGPIGTRSLRQKVYGRNLKGMIIIIVFQRYLIFYDPSENPHNAANDVTVTKEVKDVVENYKTTVNKVILSYHKDHSDFLYFISDKRILCTTSA